MPRVEVQHVVQISNPSTGRVVGGSGATVQIKTRKGDGTAGSNATYYTAVTGGSSATASLTCDANGRISYDGREVWIDPGRYLLTISGNNFTTYDQSWDAVEVSTSSQKLTSWLPTNAKDETIPRWAGTSDTGILTSGTLFCAGNIVWLPGQTITSATFVSAGTGATGPTNQWACLVRVSDRAILAVSSDATTAAWSSNTAKNFTFTSFGTGFSSGINATANAEPCYVGLMVAATTPPTMRCAVQAPLTITQIAPILCGTSTGSLTTPLSAGTTVSALTATGSIPYAYVS